jgi:hypothetical protein
MKAQGVTIGFVLNILLVFVLMSYTYVWGSRIYEESIEESKANSIERFLFLLDEKIQEVAKFGGRAVIDFKIPATIEIKINKTSGLYNLIEVRAQTAEIANTSWRYLNTYRFHRKMENPFETFSVIRSRKEGKKIVYQLYYKVLIENNRGVGIYLEPTLRRICSNDCKVIVEKAGMETFNLNGIEVKAVKVRVKFQ